MTEENNKLGTIKIVGLSLIALIFFIYIAGVNYLLYHTLLEIIIIVIGMSLIIISLVTQKISDNNYFSFMGLTYGIVALINIFHLITYKGMNIIGVGANVATQLWIAQRYFEAIALLISFKYLTRKINIKNVIISNIIAYIALMLSIFVFKVFPQCFIEGYGLTDFKIYSEYIIAFLFIVIIILYYKNMNNKNLQNKASFLITSMVFKIISGLSFVIYINVYDISNFMGHLFNFISYIFLYIALIQALLKEPYQSLFQGLSDKVKKLTLSKEDLEKKLRELEISHGIYEDLIRTMPKGIIVLEGRSIIYINSYMEKLLKIKKEDKILDRNIYELIDVTCHDDLKDKLRLLDQEKGFNEEHECLIRWERDKYPVKIAGYSFKSKGSRIIVFNLEVVDK